MTLFGDFVTGQTLSFQRMRALLLEGGGGLQEGVVGANDLKVAQRGAGANMSVDIPAGAAWVQIDTGTRNGLAHVYNDATANVAVTASNATNPRIDQAILRYNDTSIPTGSGNTPTLEILAGTATAGATLDNRTGAAALPNDCLRLADILVPATSTSVTTANIRDRRPWARGAFRNVLETSGDIAALSAGTYGSLLASTFRLECSGAPVTVAPFVQQSNSTAVAKTIFLGVVIDGVVVGEATVTHAAAATSLVLNGPWTLPVAAGSHVFDLQAKVSAGSSTILRNATNPVRMLVREDVRPLADNT
jgi:hypothetical protein